VTEQQLDDRLSTPSPEDIQAAAALRGDIFILGAAGKMGPSLARRVCRAVKQAGSSALVTTVSRGSLETEGATHIQMDMLGDGALESLPEAPNVIYMAARKFGSTGNPELTWAANVLLPALVARRYRHSCIVSFSTGNVYPLTPVESGGPDESTPVDPVGEYAWTALGRERVFEDASVRYGTKVAMLRLNYAVECRYGVLVDIATKVWDGLPIQLAMGHVNVVWQGFANSVCFRSLAHASAPPFILNLTGADTLRVRDLAEQFGRLLGREPVFVGVESPTALLSNASLCRRMFGPPDVSTEEVMAMVADWIRDGGRLLGKPTKFQVRDGKF
jgi:nucleoside-diphosphate-sugar epimerase